MQKFLEATGENRDAAVENALKQLGLERDDVSVEVLEIGKKGFLGLGATPARVRVTYEAPDIPAAKPEVKREERKPAPKAEPKQEKPAVKAEKLATDFVTGLLAKMGVEGQVKTLPQVECDQLRLEISGPDMGPIIGRRGDTLDAIQYLGSLVLNNALDEHVRLSVDTENYREKRAESLERLARKMAMKVVKAHRSMTLEPMNPYERRIIHAALQDFNGVTTYSTGTEPGRRVVIAPDNSYRNRDRG